MTDRSLVEVFEKLRGEEDIATQKYEEGDTIYFQEHPCHTVCYLPQGEVFLYTTKRGKRTIATFYNNGDVFGLECALDYPSVRDYSAEAFCEDTQIVEFPYLDLESDFGSELKQKALEVKGAREKRLNDKIEFKRTMGAKGVICRELLNLRDMFGPEIEIKMDQLGDLVPAADKTVIRYLFNLKDKGIVERKDRTRIRVDKEGLEQELDRL